MDGMFLGLAALFRELFSEDTSTRPSPTTTTELLPLTLSTTTEIVANSTNETIVILEPEDTMHHTTATGLVVTGLLVLIVVALFALCFVLRKYCRCAYDLHYSLNYGKVPKGSVLVPTEDQLEAGELSKRSTFNVGGDSGIGFGSRHPSESRLVQGRPPTPSQQRPPRPVAPTTRGSLPRQSAEQRPLIEKESGTGTLSVQPSGLYPATDTVSHVHTEETIKVTK